MDGPNDGLGAPKGQSTQESPGARRPNTDQLVSEEVLVHDEGEESEPVEDHP